LIEAVDHAVRVDELAELGESASAAALQVAAIEPLKVLPIIFHGADRALPPGE